MIFSPSIFQQVCIEEYGWSAELLGDKSRKEIHSMRLNIRHPNHTEVGNDKEDKEDGGDNAK